MFTKKTLLKIIISIILLGGLIFLNDSKPVAWTKHLIITASRPLTQGAAMISRLAGIIKGDEIGGIIDEKLDLLELKFENEQLLTESDILRKALNFKERAGIELKGADVILYSREHGYEFILINQGENQGIAEGDFVIDSRNLLVGTVKEIEKNFSKVIIASNPDQTIAIRLTNTDMIGVAKGLGARSFSIELISGDIPLKTGDFVYLFDKSAPGNNFLIASIINEVTPKSLGLREARATLIARPDLLKNVFVVINQ